MIRWSSIIFLVLVSAYSLGAAEKGVLRFWWNEGNVTDDEINGVEDRENFFPLSLDIKQFVSAWSGGSERRIDSI